MYKLIVIFAALLPLILVVRTIFGARSRKASRAFSEFKKRIDLLVWIILSIIGCAIVYSFGELIHSLWRLLYVSIVFKRIRRRAKLAPIACP
jgi:hypothetical protein